MSIWKRLIGKRNQSDLTPPPGQAATTPPPAATTSPTSSAPLPNHPPSNNTASSAARPGPQPAATKDRVVRVFISSTFRDMQDERDILIKKIFPQLRKLCVERAVTWTEVDLRWGITMEESSEGKVLPLCLAEIQRCRPYFIGLLAERYGWVPDSIPADLLESQTWLNEHLEHSVTELEILHGLFSEEQMHRHAYFYFRDPKYLESVSNGRRQDFISEGAEAAEKLLKLKQKIRIACDEKICELCEGYANPEQLGEWILEDFTALIDRLYPKDQIPDPLDQEAMRHEAYAQSRRLAFVGRSDLIRQMDDHVGTADAKPLILTGESGCGKSALLAEWVARWRIQNPEDLIIQHYTGSTLESADWQGLVRRILGELKREFDITDELPMEPDALRTAMQDWLVKAAGSHRVVIVLDALNQLSGDDASARQLGWLPFALPANVRLLVSSLPGESLDALHRRGWKEFAVPLFARDDIALATKAYLDIFSKKLPKEVMVKIETNPAAANALYLRSVLDELRQFGKHEKLEAKAADYLSAPNLPELFDRILTRWNDDFGKDPEHPDLVRRSLCLIACSRFGLSEVELLNLLGKNGELLPRRPWTPFYLAADNTFAFRSGLLNFGHDYLRAATRKRWMEDPDTIRALHLQLADYFTKSVEPTMRKAAELPWQLLQIQELTRLRDVLVEIEFSRTVATINEYDLLQYWSRIRQAGGLPETEAYAKAIRNPREHKPHLPWLLKLMDCSGNRKASISILKAKEQLSREAKDQVGLQATLGMLAMALYRDNSPTPDLEFAVSPELFETHPSARLLVERESICRQINDPALLQHCLGDRGVLYLCAGQVWKAEPLLREQESICRDTGDLRGLRRCLGNLAGLQITSYNLNQGMSLLKQQEALCREAGDMSMLVGCLKNQADVLLDLHQENLALKMIREQIRLCKDIGLKEHLRQCLFTYATTLNHLGATEAVLNVCRELQELCEDLGDEVSVRECIRMRTSLKGQSPPAQSCIATQPPKDDSMNKPIQQKENETIRQEALNLLEMLAEPELEFFPAEDKLFRLLQLVIVVPVVDLALLPEAEIERCKMSKAEFHEQMSKTGTLMRALGDALKDNARFLSFVRGQQQFLDAFCDIFQTVQFDLAPSKGLSESEVLHVLLPLIRCKLLIEGTSLFGPIQ